METTQAPRTLEIIDDGRLVTGIPFDGDPYEDLEEARELGKAYAATDMATGCRGRQTCRDRQLAKLSATATSSTT